MNDCKFCDIIEEKADNAKIFRNLFEKDEIQSEIIYKTSNFAIIVDVGPLAEGHVMIITQRHYFSFADLNKKHWDEFYILKNKLRSALSYFYSSPIFFEHGSGLKNRGACCIDHAHLHALPTRIKLLADISKDFRMHQINGLPELCSRFAGKPYMYYEDTDGRQYASEIKLCPSQYFRKLIASKLNQANEWDWKKHVRMADELRTKEKIYATLKKVEQYFKSKFSQV